MAVQTSILADPQVGAAGLIYDSGEFHDIQTYIAQVDIPFGAAVKVSGQYCALPTVSGDVTAGKIGVAVRDDAHITGVGFKAGEPVPVMTAGRIWVATEQAIAAQASPFIRFATGGGGSQKGAWRNDADTATAVQCTSGLHCYRGVGGAGLAVMEIMHVGG